MSKPEQLMFGREITEVYDPATATRPIIKSLRTALTLYTEHSNFNCDPFHTNVSIWNRIQWYFIHFLFVF